MGQEPKFGILGQLGGTKFDNAFWLCACLWSSKMVDGPGGCPAEASNQLIYGKYQAIVMKSGNNFIKQYFYGKITHN